MATVLRGGGAIACPHFSAAASSRRAFSQSRRTVLAVTLRQVGVRTGLSFSLDAINHSIDVMARSPASASAAPALRARLAQVRRSIAQP